MEAISKDLGIFVAFRSGCVAFIESHTTFFCFVKERVFTLFATVPKNVFKRVYF
jgi:hypothetical protein